MKFDTLIEELQNINESPELKLMSKELNSELKNVAESFKTISGLLEDSEDFRYEVMKLPEWQKLREAIAHAAKFTFEYAGKEVESSASKLDKKLNKNIK